MISQIGMSLPRWLARISGSTFIGLGIMLIIASLFLLSFQAQIDDIDTILDNTFETYLEENPEEIKESLISENPAAVEYFDACETGELTEEECTISMDNPLIAENIDSGKAELKTQMLDVLSPVSEYVSYTGLAFILGPLLIILGCILLFIGVEKDLLYFGQKLSGKLAFSFGIPFAIVWYITGFTAEDYISQIAPLVEGAPEILILFLGVLFQELITPIFSPFYIPFLVITILSIAIWIAFFIIRKGKGIKAKRETKKTKKKKS